MGTTIHYYTKFVELQTQVTDEIAILRSEAEHLRADVERTSEQRRTSA